MNPQTLTVTDPCPECDGFDSTNWVDSDPGWTEWHCRYGHDWAIPVNEPGKDTPWTPQWQ